MNCVTRAKLPRGGSPLQSWSQRFWGAAHMVTYHQKKSWWPPCIIMLVQMTQTPGGEVGTWLMGFSQVLWGLPVSVVCFPPWAGPILRAQRDFFFMCRRGNMFPKFWLCHTYSFSNYPLFVQYKIINSDKQSAKGHQVMHFILIGLPFFLLC